MLDNSQIFVCLLVCLVLFSLRVVISYPLNNCFSSFSKSFQLLVGHIDTHKYLYRYILYKYTNIVLYVFLLQSK